MGRSIAVVGSGPGGMYAVQGLLDKNPDCRVDVIERLASPFGLIRGGVAPDHQKTKRVSKAYERSLSDERVRYLGNVEVGRDIKVQDLLGMYDAVILAYGAPHDNQLGVKGEELTNVYGSNAFVGWYNGHPDFKDLNPDLNVASAVIIGVGNVALDVARVLTKTKSEMSITDLVGYAAKATEESPVKDVYMLGRRGPVEAAFTNVELREMGELENASPVIDPDHLPDTIAADYMSDRDLRLREKNVETMRSFLDVSPEGKTKRVHFGFFLSPIEILGTNRVEGVRCERTTVDANGKVQGIGQITDIPAQLVITCIGSRAFAIDDLPFNDDWGIIKNEDGKVSERLYAVGWLKRGASGTIGTNKNDSIEVVDKLISELEGPERDGCSAINEFLARRGVR
ncbi:MAG: FAD-dependent oxidoreductase, partial [Pseudomonadota bacterium]|nr:FAD-dependent oxidoreductase [Pseudomonadota bacterium]